MTHTTTLTNHDQTKLLARLRAGDERACADFVREQTPRMTAIAARYLPCGQDRDDAVQDAFISAFRALDNFDGRSLLSTWLHRVTVNACLMKLRSKSRRRETAIDDLLPTFDDTGHHIGGVATWPEHGADAVIADETRRTVRDCIDQLPESYRTVLLLRDIEGYDTDETAKALDCTPGNVKTRLHRARQALRTLLEPHMV